MAKKIFYLFFVVLIGFCSIKAFAFDLNENTPVFIDRLFHCQPYTETMYIRFYNKMYAVKKQLFGENNGKCLYKETWTENNTNYSKIITCQFTSDQIINILKPNYSVPLNPDNVIYPMSNDRKIMYLYSNDPSVCKVSN